MLMVDISVHTQTISFTIECGFQQVSIVYFSASMIWGLLKGIFANI